MNFFGSRSPATALKAELELVKNEPAGALWETDCEGGMLARITTRIPNGVRLGPGDILTFECMLRLEPNGTLREP